jgi:peptidoglycan/LPS O-acetylase OafA/YrhL
LAACYVIAYHAVLVPNPQLKIPGWLAPFLLNGGTGVILFFLISGFTLCLTLDGRQHRPHSTYNFYVRRIFRITPLYYVWLIGMAVVFWGSVGPLVAIRAYKLTFLLYALFGYNFVPGQQEGLVLASWTLGVEMVFYALFPWVFRVANTLRRASAFLLLALAVASLHYLVVAQHPAWLAAGYRIYLSVFFHLPIFAAGMVTYFIWKNLRNQDISREIKIWVLLAGITGFFFLPYLWNKQFAFPIAYAMTLVYALLFMGLSFFPDLPVVNRLSVFIGLISYSLYLNHPILLGQLSTVFAQIYTWPCGDGLHYLTCLAVLLIPLIALSYLTYRIIEQPFISLAKRFNR